MVQREQFVNNAATTLNGALTDVATSVTVTDGSVFPAEGDFRVLVNSEVMLVTARATNVLTVVRGYEGTTAASHLDLDDIKAILTEGNILDYVDDSIGIGQSMYGGFQYRKPYRMLDFSGNTLDKTDFTWVDKGSTTDTDTSAGGIGIEDPDTATIWRIATRPILTPPYAVTVHFNIGAGHATLTGGQSGMSLGWRDSATNRRVAGLFLLGTEAACWQFTNSTTSSGKVANELDCEWRYDSAWFKMVDDGTNFTWYISQDSMRWYMIGWDTRTAWLASPDEMFWGFNSRGEADKRFVLNSWIEHVDDEPLGLKYESQSVEFNTDVGTTQTFPSTVGRDPAVLTFLANTQGNAAGTPAADAGMSLSIFDGTDEFVQAGYSKDGETTVDDSRTLKATIYITSYVEDFDNPQARATPAWNSGDFQLTWNRHFTTGETKGAISFFGGSRHQAKAMNFAVALGGGAGLSQSITGVGFAPDAVINVDGAGTTYSGFCLSGDNSLSIGFASRDGTQASVTHHNDDGQATSDSSAYTSDAWTVARFTTASATRGFEVTAWEADGVEVTSRGGGMTYSPMFLFLKFQAATDSTVITLDWPGTTGEQTFDFGFKPRFVIMASVYSTSLNTIEDLDAGLAISVIDATTQTCCAQIIADNVATTECQSLFDNKAVHVPTTTGGTLWAADFVEFTSSGMKLDFTTVDVATKAIAMGFR